MSAATVSPAPPWAFWAPSSDGLIAAALELAGVGPGTRFLDLGCGDGRVLVAAAQRGAKVRGVEIDPGLAERARDSLRDASLAGDVEVGDMFAVPYEADVIYAYLTPVMLSLLGERLVAARPGTRVVTPRYGITGWQPSASNEGCYLYELPGRRAVGTVPLGWEWRATVLKLPAGRRVLVPLTFGASPGPLGLEVDPQLARASEHAAGSTSVDGPGLVPVDLIFSPHGAGSVIAGSIAAQDAEITVAAVFLDEGHGQWNFGPAQGSQFRAALDAAIEAARRPQTGTP